MITYEIITERFDTSTLFRHLQQERDSQEVGYYHLPSSSVALIPQARELDADFDTIVHIGIGGSSLGTKALYSVFKPKTTKRMIFLENPDPTDIKEKLHRIDPQRTLFFVVSKSGTTIETITIFKIVLEHFGLALTKAKNICVITDPDSPLDRFAAHHHIRSYHIPKNVGGRFSVLSAVGIVPLTLAGIDTQKLLEGAQAFLDLFFAQKADHLLQKALYYTLHAERYPMNVLFSYASELEDFTKWYVQLWGESLGKRIGEERVGLTPIGHLGSVDQHSFLQLLIDGPLDKTVTFLKMADFTTDLLIPHMELEFLDKTDFVNGHRLSELINAECDATKEALTKMEVPNDLIELESLNEESIGELIVYYELLTSATAAALGVNAYDQPGVELGKRILRAKFEGEK